MIRCAKCDNDTRTSGLVTAGGEVLLAGTIGHRSPAGHRPSLHCLRIYRALCSSAAESPAGRYQQRGARDRRQRIARPGLIAFWLPAMIIVLY